MNLLYVIVAVALGSHLAFAKDDSEFGRIKGKYLDLVYRNHALAGAIAETPVFSAPIDEDFGNQIWLRIGESTVSVVLTKTGETIKLSGTYKDDDGEEKRIQANVEKIEKKEGKIHLRLGKRQVLVQVSSKEMNDNHYVNPTFKISSANKTIHEFSLVNGDACITCALRISIVITSILDHFGKL